jgi:uncharacterized protein YgiM (DUF1202 family)
MRKVCAALGVLVALTASAWAQSRQDFQLVNRTGYEISSVFVSASKTNEWEDDVLSDDTLNDGETLNVRFKGAGKTCLFDIKVVYEEDDSEAIWHDIDLCKTAKVTIKYNKKTDTTTAFFD